MARGAGMRQALSPPRSGQPRRLGL